MRNGDAGTNLSHVRCACQNCHTRSERESPPTWQLTTTPHARLKKTSARTHWRNSRHAALNRARPLLMRTRPKQQKDSNYRVRTCPVRSCPRSEEHTSELQSRGQLVCRRLLEKT